MTDVEVWEQLAEWERYTNDRRVDVDDGGMLKVGAPFNMSACDGPDVFYGHGDTATAAARQLLDSLPNIPERPSASQPSKWSK